MAIKKGGGGGNNIITKFPESSFFKLGYTASSAQNLELK